MSKKINNINKLCIQCIHKCKQSDESQLLGCPRFEKKPLQLEFSFAFAGKIKE